MEMTMTMKNKQDASKLNTRTIRTVLFAGLIMTLIVPLSGMNLAYAGKAGYVSGQSLQNVIKLQGNIYVYKYLLGNVGEYQNSLIYATDNADGFTVGVGYYGVGQTAFPDKVYKLSYLDIGSTYNNIHYFGSETTTEGLKSVELTKNTSSWTTKHEGSTTRTMNCPGTPPTCPSNFRLFGAATNTNSALSSVVLAGTFTTLKGTTTSIPLSNWNVLVNDHKCNSSTGVTVTHSNYNSVTVSEGSAPPGCSNVSFAWLYNNFFGSFGT
jgi:hypothetical protein